MCVQVSVGLCMYLNTCAYIPLSRTYRIANVQKQKWLKIRSSRMDLLLRLLVKLVKLVMQAMPVSAATPAQAMQAMSSSLTIE